MGIISFFRKIKTKRNMKLLLEHNPETLQEFIDDNFYGDAENIINDMKDVVGKVKDIDIDKMLTGLKGKDLQRIVEFLIDNNYEFNLSKALKQDNNLLSSYKIAFYCLEHNIITYYDFLRIHHNAEIDFENAISQDIRCIEFAPNSNPKLFVHALSELQKKIMQEQNEAKKIIDGTSTLTEEEQWKIRASTELASFEEFAVEKYNHIVNLFQVAIDIIEGRRPVEKGKYHIPIEELFNNIRTFVKCYTTKEGCGHLYIKPIEAYIEKDGFFEREFGEQFARIYYNPTTIMGIHNNSKKEDSALECFFKSGLNNHSKSINYNVATQESLNKEVGGFENFSMPEMLAWHWNGGYNIIFQFPRQLVLEDSDQSRLGGSPLIEDGVIPPKYIVGAFDSKNPDTKLILNPYYLEKPREHKQLDGDER